MKKCLFLILFNCLFSVMLAQERKYYCEAICNIKTSGKENVYLDFGDKKTIGLMDYNNDCKPVDQEKKEIEFYSRADILYWMADKGWNLETTTSYISKSFIIVYTFSKTTTREKIKEGIVLKGDKK